MADPGDWNWLSEFLQTEVDLAEVMRKFSESGRTSAARGWVLPGTAFAAAGTVGMSRVVHFVIHETDRADPSDRSAAAREIWHSSELCRTESRLTFAFPTAAQIAVLSEVDLRSCKMGFRAPYLLAAAQRVHAGEIDLAAIGSDGMWLLGRS
jgi:hypothetical protein